MNIIMITTAKRKKLVDQSIQSLISNSSNWNRHNLLVVVDNPEFVAPANSAVNTKIEVNAVQKGASWSRNHGAASIQSFHRHQKVMFIDDDIYACPHWDDKINEVIDALPHTIVSGHAHPFNHHLGLYDIDGVKLNAAAVLSTVHMTMSWEIWDTIGPFALPGGPGGSEDVDWCKRATGHGYGLVVTEPQCIIHCGLTSSRGERIVGYDLMTKQNDELIKRYKLNGKVYVE